MVIGSVCLYLLSALFSSLSFRLSNINIGITYVKLNVKMFLISLILKG